MPHTKYNPGPNRTTDQRHQEPRSKTSAFRQGSSPCVTAPPYAAEIIGVPSGGRKRQGERVFNMRVPSLLHHRCFRV